MLYRRFFTVILFVISLERYFSEGTGNHKDPHVVADNDRTVSTIVHLFEWKFSDVAKECERFLSKYGYTGVQVSPVNENIILKGRPWYERYQPLSYKIATRSGDENDFIDMVKRCNKVGIRIYVDVLLNHMTADYDDVIGTAGSTANPSKRYYPGAGYNISDFHTLCSITDSNSAWQLRNCELWGLHDLNQTVANVQDRITEFMNKLIDIGVAGIRVDAAKHIYPEDLKQIYGKLKPLNTNYFPQGSNAFIYQEVIDIKDNEPIKADEYTDFGLVTDFRYPVKIGQTFRGKYPLNLLKTWGPGGTWDLLDGTDALVFIDNHDLQRGHGGHEHDILMHKTLREYKMANAFMLAWPHGFPKVMSSFYFNSGNQGPPHDEKDNILDVVINPDMTCSNGWTCEHRWQPIYNMVMFRNVVAGTKVTNWWDNGNNQIAFCRGNKGFIAFNGEIYPLHAKLQTCLPPGHYCDIITGSKQGGTCTGSSFLVDKDGFAEIYLNSKNVDGVIATHHKARISNE